MTHPDVAGKFTGTGHCYDHVTYHCSLCTARQERDEARASLAASEAAALVVDAQAEALLERATAAEAARERAERRLDEDEAGTRDLDLAARLGAAESALEEARRGLDAQTRNFMAATDATRAALARAERAEAALREAVEDREVMIVNARHMTTWSGVREWFKGPKAAEQLARWRRALTPGADAPQTKEKAP